MTNRQAVFDSGCLPDFLPETAHIRNDPTWRVAPAPADLQDRRVEITGPVINGLNSGASTYMADFEDSSSPTWTSMVRETIARERDPSPQALGRPFNQEP
ncbi:unnamed protein product [Discosporangium mesarthrocarpum]